ncbi:MAG: tyrosine-type recombinase/integrase [Gemmatimonadaceae bacterium]
MMVYRRKNRTAWFVAVPTPHGWVKRSTGTAHKPTAIAIERMLTVLGPKGRREWDVLERVANNSLALGVLFDAYCRNDLDRLRAEQNDLDLEPHVAIWLERIREKVAPETARHYGHMVRSLVGSGCRFFRSRFTPDELDAWLSAYPGSRSTQRKAHAAMSGFAAYLVRARILTINPLRSVEPPPPNAPRLRYVDVPEMKRLANSQEERFGVLSALLGGSGIEVSVAVKLRRRDIDLERREVRASGTKTHARDRIVRVAEWAWEYVEDHCQGLRPNDLLFPGIDRFAASDSHREACGRLGIEGYQLRDQRHSYAVRAARAGTPAELISRQLGHANAVLVLKVYGRFMPSQQERDKWEMIATLQDLESAKFNEIGTGRGTSSGNDMSQPQLSDWPIDSKGGTRIGDPRRIHSVPRTQGAAGSRLSGGCRAN